MMGRRIQVDFHGLSQVDRVIITPHYQNVEEGLDQMVQGLGGLSVRR